MARTRVLAAIAAGGALGSAARYGMHLIWPSSPDRFDWATLTTNAVGCLLIGVLMVLVDVMPGRTLLRPFLGIGVLGGFTTFSTYAVGVPGLVAAGRPVVATAYLAGTVVAAIAATWLGVVVARRLTRRGR